MISQLFVGHTNLQKEVEPFEIEQNGDFYKSTILSLKNGFGFIKFPENNLFFHYTSLLDTDFNDLEIGDQVEFTKDVSEDGSNVARNVKLIFN